MISEIVNHPLFEKQLFWCSDADDVDLDYYYNNSAGLIAASYAEGYGLPLIEAAKRNIPILARDIPVFREVAGQYATYFDSSGDFLYYEVETWLGNLVENTAIQSGEMPILTWPQSVTQLISAIFKQKDTSDKH